VADVVDTLELKRHVAFETELLMAQHDLLERQIGDTRRLAISTGVAHVGDLAWKSSTCREQLWEAHIKP
jgi:hypothetical protein